MEITCLQMDVLISFYIDGELSDALKTKVEEHLKECPVCRAKLNIISSLFTDVKKKYWLSLAFIVVFGMNFYQMMAKK